MQKSDWTIIYLRTENIFYLLFLEERLKNFQA